jgi:hypothetical protein
MVLTMITNLVFCCSRHAISGKYLECDETGKVRLCERTGVNVEDENSHLDPCLYRAFLRP